VAYFLALQDTRFGPTKMAKPHMDRLSLRKHTQSASEKALRKVDEDFMNVIQIFNVSFTYLRIRFAVVQCSIVGA
jgi:hypothetical protein